MKPRSEKMIFGGVFLIFLAMTGIILVSIRQSQTLHSTTARIADTNDKLHILENLIFHAIDNATHARGFALTGHESSLLALKQTETELISDLAGLKKFYGKNDSLEKSVAGRIAFSNQIVSTRQQKRLTAVATLVMDGQGESYLNHIRRLISGLETKERQTLQQLNAKRQNSFLLLNRLLLGSLMTILLFIVVLLFLVKKELVKRKNIQSELSRYNERLAEEVKQKTREQTQIFERISDAFTALDKNWNYTYLNKKAASYVNKKPEELIGKNIWQENPEWMGLPFQQAYFRAMEQQKYVYHEEYNQAWDLWFELNIYPSPEGISVFFRDVTERKKADLEIRKKNAFIESIIHASPDIIYIYDIEEAKNIFINEGIQRNLGYSDEEIKQMGNQVLPLLMPKEDFESYLKNTYPRYASLKDKEILTHELRMRHKDGNLHWFSTKESIFLRKPDGTPKQIFGLSHDITQRKQTELILQENIFSLSEAQRIAKMGNWTYYMDGKLKWSENMHLIYGLPSIVTDPSSDFFFQLLHPDDRGKMQQWMQNCMAGHHPGEYEFRCILPDGSIHYYYGSGEMICDNENKPVYLQGVVQDITEQKMAQEKLAKSEELFSGVFHASPAAILITRIANGRIIDANESFLSMFEFSRDEVIDHTSLELNMLTPDERAKLIQKQLETGGLTNHELLSRTKSGKHIYLLFSSKQLLINDESCHLTTLIDITDRKRAEEEIKNANEQLRQLTAYLQSVREEERKRISREIHDELGQQLTAIKMDLAWLDKKITDTTFKSKLKNSITLLDESNLSIRKILNELRMGVLEHQGLADALDWMLQQFKANTGILVSFIYDKQIDQVNESVAACVFRVCQEALTNITRYAKAKKVKASLMQSGYTLQFIIEDDGIGFDESQIKMKTSFGILGMKERVKALKGTFDLLTATGKGTKIIISLPLQAGTQKHEEKT
jgi:PAS domain S-box-containing protein